MQKALTKKEVKQKPLTRTENKIAHLVACGLTEQEISAKLFISEHTVHTHTRNIRKKTNSRNMVDIARHYILGLSDPKSFSIAGVVFLMIQIFMVFSMLDFDVRKLKGKRVAKGRIVRVQSRTKNA